MINFRINKNRQKHLLREYFSIFREFESADTHVFQCDKCNYKSSSANGMKIHKTKKHIYICRYCNQKFKNLSDKSHYDLECTSYYDEMTHTIHLSGAMSLVEANFPLDFRTEFPIDFPPDFPTLKCDNVTKSKFSPEKALVKLPLKLLA